MFPSFIYSLPTTSCFSLQSYHDPDSEEEDVRLASEIVAGASVTSGQDVSPPEEEKQTSRDTLEGEEKEDLPEQPPPVEEKPKEGKEYNFSSNTNWSAARKTKTQVNWLISSLWAQSSYVVEILTHFFLLSWMYWVLRIEFSLIKL